ncbi:MAG TPA: 1-acyl-sn-glycerol-3-phosphate acyltransferase [Polyangia bacterium]|jgi:glycerol-3-phosphate O-acyltransferase
MRAEDRQRIQVEVAQRVVDRYAAQAGAAPEGFLQTVVNDTIYHERRRLSKAGRAETKDERAYYKRAARRLRRASETELRALLDDMARRFVAEVVGNFDPRVYQLSTTVIPTALSLLLHAMSPMRLLALDGVRRGLADHLKVQGATAHACGLLAHGTLVVVPTHSSNLDSILLGYAAHLLGLPPLLYGAGLNLFTNPLISFFMRNLGAYRVDRRKTAGLYKEVLKEYATCATEMGYHQLFFPGGTRSRSGALERQVKKGLLGTAVRAYVNNLLAGRPRPKVFIVPCTISYALVLEAETLMADHLKETGKARYIIDDDEFSRPRRIANFLGNAISLDDEIVITVSPPLDVLGNPVDEAGNSLDPRGRPVDTRTYVSRDGAPVADEQRDMEYTNEVAEAVCQSYRRDNVLMTTNVVARALFDLMQRANPMLDLYRLLRTGGRVASYPLAELHAETERLLGAVRRQGPGPRLCDRLRTGEAQDVVADALAHFGTYHTRPPAVRRGDRVFHDNRNLLLYYGNRLNGYPLSR